MELATEKQTDYIKALIEKAIGYVWETHNALDREQDLIRQTPFKHVLKIAVIPSDLTKEQASALISKLKLTEGESPSEVIRVLDNYSLLPLLGKAAAALALRFLDADKPYALYMAMMAEVEAQEIAAPVEEIKSVNDTYVELMTEDDYSFRRVVYSEGFDPKVSFNPRWVVAVEKALLDGISSLGTIRILQANQRLSDISFPLNPSKYDYWELKNQLVAQANILLTDAQRIIDICNRPTKRSAEHLNDAVGSVNPKKYWGLLGANELEAAVFKYHSRPNEQYAINVAQAMRFVAGIIGKAVVSEPEGLSDEIPVSAD